MDERCAVCFREFKKGDHIVSYGIKDEEEMFVVAFQVHCECDKKKDYVMDREIATY